MVDHPKPGDIVKVETEGCVVVGRLMPRPELMSSDIVVVKQESGYNVGIEKDKIRKLLVVQKYKPVTKSVAKIQPKAGLPTVVILSTGGTISSKVDYHTGAVHAEYTAEDFVMMCPEILNVANIRAKKIMSKMSEDLTPNDWVSMAKVVAQELQTADGVVITHGTDTLHYTAAALSFFLKNLSKPVIITGAQRSIDRGSSDAFMNLACSVIAAAKFDGAEVMTCMHESMNDDVCSLIKGTSVRKMHTSRRDAFRPVNDLPLARVSPNGTIEPLTEQYRKRSAIKTTAETKFDEQVALVMIYPNMDPGVIEYHLKKGVRGIVLAATALGHVPIASKKSLFPVLEKAVKKKIPVVITSQTLYGSVHPLVYAHLRKLSVGLGCTFISLIPEVAYVKLIWALGQSQDLKKVKQLMQMSIVGELHDREIDDTFLR